VLPDGIGRKQRRRLLNFPFVVEGVELPNQYVGDTQPVSAV
jgi:hypothetical protein